jgi:hypothetical protein
MPRCRRAFGLIFTPPGGTTVVVRMQFCLPRESAVAPTVLRILENSIRGGMRDKIR